MSDGDEFQSLSRSSSLGEENQLKNKTHNLKTKRVKKQKD
jgi:hypothetical protein